MSILSYEEVEARVQKDVRPEPHRIIQRTVDRYRSHQSSLVCVTTIDELIGELEALLVYFYHRLIHAGSEQEHRHWEQEWKRLGDFLLQLKTMYSTD